MSPLYITVIIAYALALTAGYFDAHFSSLGIKAGIAKEGSPINKFFLRTDTPTFNQLMVLDYILTSVTFAVSFIPGPARYPHTWVAFSLGALIATALQHVRGARQWKWSIAHPGQTMPVQKKWWQQFLGFLGLISNNAEQRGLWAPRRDC